METNKQMDTEYYVAIILYKSSSDSKEYTPLYEESIALIQAVTESDARKKSEALARSRHTTFKNRKGEQITWELYKIVDVRPMLEDDIGDATEIYSRHFRSIDAYNVFDTLEE